jgi:hypothetical protein
MSWNLSHSSTLQEYFAKSETDGDGNYLETGGQSRRHDSQGRLLKVFFSFLFFPF